MDEPELAEATNQSGISRVGKRLAAMLARPAFMGLLLAVVTVAVFWPVRNCDYINYDDPVYVTSNPHVRQGLTANGVVWAFTTIHSSNWHPLTWLSHMFDVELFGLKPAGPHLVNLLWHTANTVLLFLVLRQLTGAHGRSALVAALFALHPLHVESVAWISERKDVLSTFWGFLAIGTYGRYVQEAEGRGQRAEAGDQKSEGRSPSFTLRPLSSGSYRLALLFFGLSLMTRPMLVTLPFVLLLLDYWPLNRMSGFRRQASGGERLGAPGTLIWEKLPFLLLSALSCAITLFAQHKALVSLASYPFSVRVGNALVAYARYLGKVFWPTGLALPYPHPGQWPVLWVVGSALLVAGLSAVALGLGRKLPFFITGWFWFLGTLVPVIGLVQVGIQSMADRYTYVPLTGLFIIVVWAAGAGVARWRAPKIATRAAGVLVLGVCAMQTRGQLQYWRNSETLFRHTIAVTENNYLAYDNLGFYLTCHGQSKEALELYRQALRINPADYLAYNNIGFCYYLQSRLDDAITNYRRALRINPIDPSALNNLGTVLIGRKEYAEAINCLKAALRSRPDYPDARNNLEVALDKVGRTTEAIQQLSQALRLDPGNAEAHNNFANALIAEGKIDAAIEHYRQALKLEPDFSQALDNLGYVLACKGRLDEALACYSRALELKPEDEMIHKTLGKILAQMGRNEEAIRHLTEALRLVPIDAEAHFDLGCLLAESGRRDEAVKSLKEALRLKPGYTDAERELRALDTRPPE